MDRRVLRILEFDKILSMLKEHTVSTLGEDHALRLLPSTDIDEIKAELMKTCEGVEYLVKKGQPPFGRLTDISTAVKKANIGSVLSPPELLEVGRVLRSGRHIKRYIEDDKDITSHGWGLSSMVEDIAIIADLEEEILRCITEEGEVSDDASSRLRSIRKDIRESHGKIRDKLNNIIHSPKYQKILQESIITIRNGRYVVPVKQEYKNSFPGLVHDQSASGATLFIEPLWAVEQNNRIKHLEAEEKREIERILTQLTQHTADFSEQILKNMDILGRLDLIFAKAKLALEMDAFAPRLTDEGFMQLKSARHPLIDRDKVVPIDVTLGGDFTTIVITGPNTGGKTVTLKTIGLLSVMAQAGLLIPADRQSTVNVFKNIYADIGDEQSIEQSLSTFSSHMVNIVSILNRVKKGDLVLLDELGAGTDPTEGAALAMALLEFLHKKGVNTVATTHYSELKAYAGNRKGMANASVEFDITTLRPTYRLLLGLPGKSNAFAISEKLGLSKDIIDHAKSFLTTEHRSLEELLAQIEKDRQTARLEREEAHRLNQEAREIKEKYQQLKDRLEQQKSSIVKEARIKAQRILEEARSASKDIIKELRSLKTVEDASQRNKNIERIRQRLKGHIDRTADYNMEDHGEGDELYDADSSVKPGDTVYITDLKQRGTVLNLNGDSDEALVQVGVMKINVKKRALKFIDEQKAQTQRLISTLNGVTKKSRPVSLELDLRGNNLEEALISVDKYLDDAFLAGLSEVTLIHGKGTGTLRAGIHKHLKHHAHVSSFRLGKFGEGEDGVTVVRLK
ncbi:MAG TPA: endonuclease MutS2 [Clostridiales bacterium]|nr:endonuclease MutS2 [Clostridiales bacterium]